MSASVAALWRGPDAREQSPSDIWAAVGRLVDRAPTVSDLISHKLELFAIQRWRAMGRVIPPELLERERAAAVNSLVAPLVFERVRAAYGGGIIPMKGPVVAARYPDPALRAFRDLDLLVENPSEAHAHLVAAGFEEIDDPSVFHNADLHHLRPLWWPGLPLGVELHSRPNWPLALAPPPPREELFAVAEPLDDGVRMLPPSYHALLLAAHSWRHEPLRLLRDMLDVVVMADAAGRANVAALAREWGVERLWGSTISAADAAFRDDRTWAMRLWAQNLGTARERTVLENHLTRWLSDFWIMPPRAALAGLPRTFAQELRPVGSETWRAKLSRGARAVRNASRRRSEHDERTQRR